MVLSNETDVTWHEKTGLVYTKYTYSYYSMYQYLHYCIRLTKSVNCIKFPMKSCINGENYTGLPCVYMKLFNFEIQKCGPLSAKFGDLILCCNQNKLISRNYNCLLTKSLNLKPVKTIAHMVI